MLRYHIETFLILLAMLAHRKFRLCQETEHWPRSWRLLPVKNVFIWFGTRTQCVSGFASGNVNSLAQNTFSDQTYSLL